MRGVLRDRQGDTASGTESDGRALLQPAEAPRAPRIGRRAQILIGVGSIALIAWCSAFAARVAVDYVAADAATQGGALSAAFESRLDQLSAERDQSFAEAASAQARFRTAMERIGRQQTEILAAAEERREMEQALASLQARLAEAESGRRAAEAAVAEAPASSGAEMAATLAAVTTALDAAVTDRDAAQADRETLSADLAEARLKARVTDRRQEEMVAQLRAAVAQSSAPLEDLLKKSGLDADSLLATARNDYSGEGGPLIPIGVSTRNFPGDAEASDRFDSLMVDVDRMNLLRIALGKVPYANPLKDAYRFTSPFGMRSDPFGRGRRGHTGVDFAGPSGTPIYATADGVVVAAGRENGYGLAVRVQHDFGFETLYAHQSRLRVKVGQRVSRGDRIGDMGSTGRSTGSHLHYEVIVNGRQVNPMTYVEAAKDVF